MPRGYHEDLTDRGVGEVYPAEACLRQYTSASEIVREGLRLLVEQEKLKEARLRELRGKIEKGWAFAERGELIAGERVFAAIRKELEGKGRRRRMR